MTKLELIIEVARKSGYSKHDVRIIADIMFGEIKSRQQGGERVYIDRFGTFDVVKREKTNFVLKGKAYEKKARLQPRFRYYNRKKFITLLNNFTDGKTTVLLKKE